MNCDNCDKPVFIQMKIMGPLGACDVNLCHNCYKEYMDSLKNEIISNSDFRSDSDEQLNNSRESLEEIAKQISDAVEHLPFEKAQRSSNKKDEDRSVCPVCNMPFDESRNYSSIGCKYCYDHFRELTMGKRSSGGYLKYYKGKLPKNFEKAKETLEKLDGSPDELFIAMDREGFERCHDIQMKIDDLESKLQEYRGECYE